MSSSGVMHADRSKSRKMSAFSCSVSGVFTHALGNAPFGLLLWP